MDTQPTEPRKTPFWPFMKWFILGPAILATLIGWLGHERGEVISAWGRPLEGLSGITTLVSVSAFAGFMFGLMCWILVRSFREANRFPRRRR